MRAFRFLSWIAWAWVITGMIMFLLGAAISLAGAPRWLPLPWSDVDDFVEGSDGDIYVGLGFYHRVQRYDASGHFLASYRAAGSKGIHLAADLKGRIFDLPYGAKNELTVLSRSWESLAVLSGLPRSDDWRLDENGEPVSLHTRSAEPAVDRAAGPTDYIFCQSQHRRSFQCMDGSQLVQEGHHLQRVWSDGRVMGTYSSPWFLEPFTFPWPMASAWVLAFLLMYVGHRHKKLSQVRGVGSVHRLLALEVVVIAGMIAAVGAIWFAGLALLIDLINRRPYGEEFHVLTVIWFLGGPVVAIGAGKVIQRRFSERAMRSIDR